MTARSSNLFVLFYLILLALPGPLLGQFDTTRITGIITDDTGARLPGVTVRVTNQQRGTVVEVISNNTGNYTVAALRGGIYRLEVELEGFKKYVQSDIELAMDQVARIDVKLELGQLEEEIHVVGEAPILNTETAEKGSVIYNEEIIDLPMETREFFDLAFLTVGVTPEQEGGQGGYASVNGARLDSMNFVVDGGNNNIMRAGDATVRPNIDSIQEFKVQTSNYSAEYGRRSTGVINVVLKSGSNEVHGNVFHFHRNSALDAANFFDPILYRHDDGTINTLQGEDGVYYDKDKAVLIRNNFGGNVGGPIVRDKMFFFFNFEGMRRREGLTRFGVTPTLDERQGIFSGRTNNPFTGDRFEDDTIPEDMWHPVSKNILPLYPLPNTSLGGFNHVAGFVDADDWADYTGKFDWHFGDADNLSVRYVYNDRWEDQPDHGSDLGTSGRAGDQHFQMAGLTLTHTFSPTILNQTLLNFSRKDNNRLSYNVGRDFCAEWGLAGCTQQALGLGDKFVGFPRIDQHDITDIGDNNNTPLLWTENDYHVSNTVTIIKGEHNIRFGGELVKTQFQQDENDQARGYFNFRRNRFTRQPFGDFLLGMQNQQRIRTKTVINYLRTMSYSGFLQDDWKISPKLTLNLGVRYDLMMPPHDKHDRWSNFDPDIDGLVIAADPSEVEVLPEMEDFIYFAGDAYPRSLIWADRNNIAPRVGIAWRPFSSRTVIRTGLGQFFGTSILNPVRNSLGGNPPFTVLERHNRKNSDPTYLTWDNLFPGANEYDGIATPEGYEMRPPSANLYQYNFTIEQQFMQNTVAEISYVGSKGTHLGRRYNYNQPAFVPGPDGETTAERPLPQFDGINYYAFEADSNYHAFQASIRKRGRGANWRLNYTFSKSIDDSSRLSGGSDQGYNGVQDINNRAAERALSDFDRRHALVGSILYRLPFRNNFLVRDWQINTIVRLYSGTPVSPQVDSANVFDGEANRPDRIGSGELDNPDHLGWFNVDDFPLVPEGAYRWGNAGRNILIGPGRNYFDFSVTRRFNMPMEGHYVEFRWEVFNLANFVNYRAVDPNVDISTAAQISEAHPARQMQVGLKYVF